MYEQGWCSGESTLLPPMWPGFKHRCEHHMWLEFVVHSLLCSQRFFVVLQFSPLLKNQHFPIPIRPGMGSQRTITCGGSSLLTLKGFCTLSCANHVARSWIVSSYFKLVFPLWIYPFSQEQLFSGTICRLLSLANTAL